MLVFTFGAVISMMKGNTMTPSSNTSIIQFDHWRAILKNSPRTVPKKLGFALCNRICSVGVGVITAVLIVFLLIHHLSGAGKPAPGPLLIVR